MTVIYPMILRSEIFFELGRSFAFKIKKTATQVGSGCDVSIGIVLGRGQQTGTFFPITIPPRNFEAFFMSINYSERHLTCSRLNSSQDAPYESAQHHPALMPDPQPLKSPYLHLTQYTSV